MDKYTSVKKESGNLRVKVTLPPSAGRLDEFRYRSKDVRKWVEDRGHKIGQAIESPPAGEVNNYSGEENASAEWLFEIESKAVKKAEPLPKTKNTITTKNKNIK